jgi:hypothetical protein
MAVRENNYHIINTGNKQAFIELFIKGTPVPPYDNALAKECHTGYSLSSQLPEEVILRETKRMKLPGAIRARWLKAETVWKRLIGKRPHLVVEIRLPNGGRFILLRNGINSSSINFVVLDMNNPTDFRFAIDINEALTMIELLTTDDLPLYMSKVKDSKVLMNIFRERCEGVTV